MESELVEYFKNDWEKSIYGLEKYKWNAVKIFQDNFQRIFDESENLYSVLKDAFKGVYNLVYYSQLDSLMQNAKYAPSDVRSALELLFNENLGLEKRVKSFRDKFKEITCNNEKAGHFEGKKKSCEQDDRTISVYLTLRYPERYYIYMYGIFREASYIFYDKKTKKSSKGDISNFIEFCKLCEQVKFELVDDKELIKKHNDSLKQSGITDISKYNILAQTFLYAICRLRKSRPEFGAVEEISAEELEIKERQRPKFSRPKSVRDYEKERKQNERIGRIGEEYIIDYEEKNNRKCRHISRERGGDFDGYDIQSKDKDGNVRYIEVKTTTRAFDAPFQLSYRELEFSKQHPNEYYLYRVYNFDIKKRIGDIKIIQGSMEKFAQNPTGYHIEFKTNETL